MPKRTLIVPTRARRTSTRSSTSTSLALPSVRWPSTSNRRISRTLRCVPVSRSCRPAWQSKSLSSSTARKNYPVFLSALRRSLRRLNFLNFLNSSSSPTDTTERMNSSQTLACPSPRCVTQCTSTQRALRDDFWSKARSPSSLSGSPCLSQAPRSRPSGSQRTPTPGTQRGCSKRLNRWMPMRSVTLNALPKHQIWRGCSQTFYRHSPDRSDIDDVIDDWARKGLFHRQQKCVINLIRNNIYIFQTNCNFPINIIHVLPQTQGHTFIHST